MSDDRPQDEPQEEREEQPLRMEIRGLMLDPSSNAPIVVLRDEDGRVLLPIWIGLFEANAIALRMENIATPRPLTHDLLKSVVEELGGAVQRILISDLKENTFYARIYLRLDGDRELEVDSRPSDAIALALRTEAPIYVLPSVLEKARAIELTLQAGDEERLKKWLEEVDPEDLGKYKM